MKRLIPLFCLAFALTLAVPITATADSFDVVGSVQDGYAGPATGTLVTFCEYGDPEGFSLTTTVPQDGVVAFRIPYLPRAVAMDIEGDPTFQDVHLVIAQPICPVSPCQPNQVALFEVRLKRHPRLDLDRHPAQPAAR